MVCAAAGGKLGKRKDREGNTVFYGRTPVVAIGTTDMHAQTQLHQDGRRDKAVQFLFIDSWKGRVKIRNPFPESGNMPNMQDWTWAGPWKWPWRPMRRPWPVTGG